MLIRNRHFRGLEAEENAHTMQKLKGELRKKQKLKSISRNFYYLLPLKRKEENHEEIWKFGLSLDWKRSERAAKEIEC
ncbi:hypothetical protein I3842_06G005400 [Carya illinoinensis]|uniref:Uncharacterized protein n=1 Tax=Carya illinoinensis TaxID=32201 RepID=A0A922ESL8_CARIL|nr:hypothetical protein I3842_06G005400 [Carya illinoinensis]